MSIDWTKPLVVAGTDRVATVTGYSEEIRCHSVRADWEGDGQAYLLWLSNDGKLEDSAHCQVTNAPPTPKLGPEHIEALAEAEKAMSGLISDLNATIVYCNKGSHSRASADRYAARLKSAEQRATRLAEIRAYLESL